MSKYSPEMVARIQAFAQENVLNLESLTRLAAEPMFVKADVSARGLIAKVRTMGLEYEAKPKVSKDGSPVARKDDLVVRIEKATGLTGLDSLAKADKQALRKLTEYLVGVDA